MQSSEFQPIQIKANKREGIVLVPDPSASFQEIMGYMEQKLTDSHDFFQRAEMTLDLRSRPLGTDEVLTLHRLLVDRAAVKLVEVKLSDEMSFVVDTGARRSASVSRPPMQAERTAEPSNVVVRSTCRSGSRVESYADCIVLGDVNPGAEILAVGDVIIFGHLKGIAHAGIPADRSARIWALSIEPSQIRIADLVAFPPRSGARHSPRRYEIAEVRDGIIEVISH